jgi:hypothetical protein
MFPHETAIVYVVSPDREEQLLRSIDSLLDTVSRFDLVRICCVGPRPDRWKFVDPRIRVEEVSPLFGRYFYGNKLHLCDTPARRVIFLDADTIVLRPLDALWQGRQEQLLARRGTAMSAPNWNHQVWRDLVLSSGSREVPMFNAGVLLFQHGSHLRLKDAWQAALLRFLAGDWPHPCPDRRMFEQWSLAVAVAREGISFAELDAKAHAFGWQNESADGAAVFHYGNRHFDRFFPRSSPGRPPRRSLLQ